MRCWLVIGVLAASACGNDGDCIDGVCADYAQAVSRPGPCRSARRADADDWWDLEYAYDSAGRVIDVTGEGSATQRGRMDDMFIVHARGMTHWDYDAAGAVMGIMISSFSLPDQAALDTVRWTFGEDRVTVTGGTEQVFDRSLFAFLPLVGSALAGPSAELGLVHDSTDYAWTIISSRLWTRHIVEPSEREWQYEFDDHDRLVRISSTYPGEPASVLRTWTYDGDLLVAAGGTTYRYDAGGNVVETQNGSWRELYTYDCW